MDVQVRHADSGHSVRITMIEHSPKGETLINAISQTYKISPKDQILITKIGHIIEPDELLEKVFTHNWEDKTLISSQFKEGSNKMNERISCVILFNLKELNKPEQNIDPRSKSQWNQKLKENLLNLNKLKTVIFPFEPMNKLYTNEQLQKYQKFVSRINSLKGSYQKLADEYSDLKEYNYNIEQTIQRCTVQKKSVNALVRCLKEQMERLIQKEHQLDKAKEILKSKFAIDDKSLRENSGFFQSKKKNQSSLILYEGQIKHLKQKIIKFMSNAKEEIKNSKKLFRNMDQASLNFGKKTYTKRIQQNHKANTKDFNDIIDLFAQLVQSGSSTQSKLAYALQNKIERSEQNATKILLPDYEKMCEELINNYLDFNRYTEENKEKIKDIYHWYKRTVTQNHSFRNQITLLSNTIKTQIEKENKRKISIISKERSEEKKTPQDQSIPVKQSKDQTEAIRRVNFKRRLNFIQSLSTKMCEEEEILRKKFVNDIKGNQKYEIECLKNPKVPQLDLDDNSSSDLELIKLMKNSNSQVPENLMDAQEFMVFNYNWILEKIKLLNLSQTNVKIKNLQQILKRVSDIFTKVYNNKINEVINEKQEFAERVPSLQQKITQLEKENNQYKLDVSDLQRKLVEKEELLISRERQRCEQINKERTRYEKLSSDFKSLEKTLNKQTKLNEQLYNQVLKNDEQLKNASQLNDYLKQLLAQKEIQIIEIEKKLNEKQKQQSQLSANQQSQNDLKSAVLSNFGKNITADPDKNFEIQKLNQEIFLLQKQNEELQQQYEELSSEMRKIITKQTQDIEVQVSFQDQGSITISQDIKIGQNAIFMPFGGNQYVGISHKDDDRTVANINTIQYNCYLLDLFTFPLKTRTLLTQCSFLVVLHVSNLVRQDQKILVKGEIKYLLGFEDDNLTVKNYTTKL